MTKWLIFYCFLLTVNITQAQKSDSDSSSLKNTSSSLLQKQLSFNCKKGKLENVLQQLAEEQHLKFFYSLDKIQNVNVNENSYPSTDLASLLNNILINTGFNFMVVGRIIVIVEDDKNKNLLPEENNQVSDSSITINTTSGASSEAEVSDFNKVLVNQIYKKADSVKVNENYKANHVYSSDLNLSKLPLIERRKIQKLYEKELKWAKHYKIFISRYPGIRKDTVENVKNNDVLFYENIPKRFFVSGSLGFVKYDAKIKGNNQFSWNEDLNYNSKISNSIQSGITLGFISRNFTLATGLGYQQLKIKEFGSSIYKKSNGIGQGQGNQPDTFNYSYSDKYSIFSIPFEALFFKQKKSIFAAIGPKIEMDFIHARVEADEFKVYYLNKVKEGTYSYKNHKIAFASSIKAKAGVFLKNNLAISADVQYTNYLSYLSRNSVFSLYPNNLSFQLSIYYLFDKSMIRGNLGK